MFLQRLDSFDANRCAELGASLGSLPSVSVTLPGVPMGSIACLDWNLDGSRIALGSSDASTRIFVPDYTGSRSGLRFFSAIPGHKEAISQVAWSPVVESVLAIGSSDKTVGFNDCRHKRKIGGVATKGENFILEWSPDGNFIAIGDRAGVVTIVDGRTFKIMNSYNFSKIEDVLDMSWGPDGKHLLLVGASGKVHVRTFPDLKQSYTFLGHTGACYAMEMDPGSKFLATGGQDAFVFIWELEHMVNISAISSLE